MANLFRFQISFHNSVEEAWAELEAAGVSPLYSVEDESIKEIFGTLSTHLEREIFFKQCPSINEVTTAALPEVDWSAQWKEHAHHYHEGRVHINIDENKILKLRPGPGFGDLSHPTTRLMLKMMPPIVPNCYVLDVGCGSGVLTVCAAAMGASHACGLDIDLEALAHARKNAELNQMQEAISFGLPKDFQLPQTDSIVVLMNMIWSEQEVALNSLSFLNNVSAHYLISGILKSERNQYIKERKKRGWKLLQELQEEEWCAFHFRQ